MKHEVTIIKDQKSKKIMVQDGANLLAVLKNNGVIIYSPCGGNRTCGKCRVYIEPTQAIKMSDKEAELIEKRGYGKGDRLACFLEVKKDMTVMIPSSSKAKILVEGENHLTSLKPRVQKMDICITAPTLENQKDDHTRIVDAMKITNLKVPFQILPAMTGAIRNSSHSLSCVVRAGNEILSLSISEEVRGLYGIAIDIGTTTIVAYCMELSSGKQVDYSVSLNPQRFCGADVINRINHTMINEMGLEELQSIVIKEINKMVDILCSRNMIDAKDIYEITCVGNSTMIHLLLGAPCINIASAPYIPAFTARFEIKAREIGIKINPEGYLITLPLVSAYIGADTEAAIMASGMYENDKYSLLLDIGTNGEIVLGKKDFLLCCSAAAGPAFEGADITFGLGGIDGAIDHVDLSRLPFYTVIGNVTPAGICGSGLVDLVAELLWYGIVDKTGKFRSKEELAGSVPKQILDRIVVYHGKYAFLLDKESYIVVTQTDIRKLQLAKGAIVAGINILIKEMGITHEEIEHVFLAGGFGSYLDVDCALDMGLVPKEFKGRVVQIGNAAGVGAKMALLSDDILNVADDIQSKIKYIELSKYPFFQQEFMKAMSFK